MVGGAGPELDIVDMNVLAGRDRLGGDADDLAELPHRLAVGDRLGRHLVAAADRFHRADIAQAHFLAGLQLAGRDDQGSVGLSCKTGGWLLRLSGLDIQIFSIGRQVPMRSACEKQLVATPILWGFRVK